MQPIVYEQPKQEYKHQIQGGNYHTNIPSDYLILSIFSTICCNLCFGIAAIMHSVKTREKIRNNNFLDAKEHSKTALRMSLAAIVIGILMIVIIVLIILIRAKN